MEPKKKKKIKETLRNYKEKKRKKENILIIFLEITANERRTKAHNEVVGLSAAAGE